ncbi:unnamed protein product [Coffea canephora]|uniref:Leucine-rich repeat-containing N-terminal plant-type domain-containing protein n=1 Tax=Coffea canephora TaxID=49390 RepID=A0A068VH75_COFCA|nr:unnamed protein product [Coffea canephora]
MWAYLSSTLANIFLLLLVAMNFPVNLASAAKQFQNETDSLALLELKKQIHDDPFGVLNSWIHSQHHCQWEGVTCGTRHERVIALTLRESHLILSLISTLCNATTLYYLDLSFNQFEGGNILDNVLMNCQYLQYLDISHNNFTGFISPLVLQMHPSLTYLKFGENSFSRSLPPEVGKLIHLVEFNVSHNQLAGDVPISLADLITLTGPIPKELEKLHYLRYLNLSITTLRVRYRTLEFSAMQVKYH